MMRIKTIVIIFLVVVSIKTTSAQDFFSYDEEFNCKISTNLRGLVIDRWEFPKEYPGLLEFEKEGVEFKFSINVSRRGRFRNDVRNCYFPPLLIDFKKKAIKNTVFQSNERIKVVTHCTSKSKMGAEMVYREYIAYKLAEIICTFNLKTRFGEIEYNNDNKGKDFRGKAIFLESKKGLQKRLDLQISKDSISINSVDQLSYYRFVFFQALIGNVDWMLENSHNVILMEDENLASIVYPIPYDLDMSILVQPDYFQTHTFIDPDDQIEQFKFEGTLNNEELLKKVIHDILSKKDEIYSLLNSIPEEYSKSKSIMEIRFNSFYDEIQQDKFIEGLIN